MSSKPTFGLAGLGLVLLGVALLGGPSPALQAQSTEPPPAGAESKTQEAESGAQSPPEPAPGGEAKPDPDRSGAYRRQKDELKPFSPSEEIRVDKAVDFPADI
ncbi:MAG: hypothetical protein PVJ53_04750 [Desulfobacterales bacterium]|jgi:hypothetical protein